MKTNNPNPTVATSSDVSAAAKLRAFHMAPAIIARIEAEKDYLYKRRSEATTVKEITEIDAQITKLNQQSEIERQHALNWAKNLPQLALAVLNDIGEMRRRILLLNRACFDKVFEDEKKKLSPFLSGALLQAAAEASTAVSQQRAANDASDPHIYGVDLENDGAGGARIQLPIPVLALLAGHDEAARCLAGVEKRAKQLGLAIEEICAPQAKPAVAAAQPLRRSFSPPGEVSRTRVQLRCLD